MTFEERWNKANRIIVGDKDIAKMTYGWGVEDGIQWIKIKSQKPPKGEWVLLLGYFGGDVKYQDMADYEDMIAVGVWEDDDPNYPDWFYIPSMHVDVPQKVIAWMPLPKKPKWVKAR